jgi:8-oxo-dGTP pyrophosphatase MutT (NUDIX family)
MDQREADQVATVVLLRDDGAALMQLRDVKPDLPRAGMWVIPGGHVEPGEAIEQCARRELREETCYECDGLRFLACLPDINDVTGRPYSLVVFWARYDGRQALECREGQRLCFMQRSEAANYPIPGIVMRAWDMALNLAARGIGEGRRP